MLWHLATDNVGAQYSMSTPLPAWETIKVVGKGGSSTVFRARFIESGQVIAVKQIDMDGLSREQVHSIKAEIDTMKALSHEHIIQYLGAQQSANKMSILLEFADRGSLRQYYQSRGPLKEPQVVNCTRQILQGLKYLHDNSIAHRDIKVVNTDDGDDAFITTHSILSFTLIHSLSLFTRCNSHSLYTHS